MLFGGLIKNSLIDYPEKLAAVLFTRGCNFHCPYCHNKDLINFKSQDEDPAEEEIFNFLKSRRNLIDSVVITGGEPCMHNDLIDYLKRIKEMGYLIKLDTNGSRPLILKSILDENLVDLVAMDIKSPFEDYKKITGENDIVPKLQGSVELIINSKTDYIFRTTCAKPFITIQNIEGILREIQGAKNYHLQNFKRDSLLTPHFFKDIEDHTKEDMEKMAEIAKKHINNCKII